VGEQISASPVLVFSVLVFGITLAIALWYLFWVKKASVFDPAPVFLAFYALFVMPLPLRLCFTQEVAGDISDQLPTFASYVPFAVLLCTAGIFLFLWAYFFPLNAKLAAHLPIPAEPQRAKYFKPLFSFDKTRFAAISICLLSLFLISRLTAGGILAFLLLGYNSSEIMFGKGYLAVGIPWFFVGSTLFLYRYSVKKSGLDLLVFGILLLLQAAALLLLGERGSILNYVLIILVFWHFAVHKIRFTRLAVVTIILYLGLNLVSFARQSNYESLEAFAASTTEALTRSAQGEESTFYTLTSGEFAVPFETFPQIIRKFGSDAVPCRWGLTYLESSLQFIPQAIFPNRPPALGHWYMETFYGTGWTQNVGRQFFFLAEGYMNFGPFGVFIAMSFWGLFLGILHQYRRLNPGNPGVALFYAISVAFIFRCISGDSASMIVGLPEQFLLLTALALWYSSGFRWPIALRACSTLPNSALRSTESRLASGDTPDDRF
jgi:hypothetical protein